MNSETVTSNYATDNDMIYGAHYVTLVSPKITFESNSGKFSVSYITPNISGSKEYSKTLPKNSTMNVINDDNLDTSKITTSNTLTLDVPKHYFYIISINPTTGKIKRKEYLKGQKFVVVNAGGNVDSPCIVGVVE